MKIQTAFRPTLLSLFGSLLLASAVGCGGVVSNGGGDGGGGEGGESGDGGAGGGSAGGSNAGGANPTGGTTDPDPGTGGSGGNCDPAACEPPTLAIALTYAQLDSSGTGGAGSGTTTGVGGGVDPATQFLKFGAGTEAPSCAAPNGSGGCGGWSASISIAPALFQVGVLPFSDPGVDISVFESMDEGNGQCSGGGGGGFEEGQIEILAISATTVEFVVSGVTPVFESNPNGTHLAIRCP